MKNAVIKMKYNILTQEYCICNAHFKICTYSVFSLLFKEIMSYKTGTHTYSNTFFNSPKHHSNLRPFHMTMRQESDC